jgi:LysM repeat protein
MMESDNIGRYGAMIAALIAAVAATAGTVLESHYSSTNTTAIIENAQINAAAERTAEARLAWPGELQYHPVVTYKDDQSLEVQVVITNCGRAVAPGVIVQVVTNGPIVDGPHGRSPYENSTPTVTTDPYGFYVKGGDLTPDIRSELLFSLDCAPPCSASKAEELIRADEWHLGCDNCPSGSSDLVPSEYVGFPATPTPTATLTPTPSVIAYVVQSGDTLSSISREFGVPVQAIRDANPSIVDPRLIRPGDTIYIPTQNPLPVGPDGPRP